jgi:hypothetical protein
MHVIYLVNGLSSQAVYIEIKTTVTGP